MLTAGFGGCGESAPSQSSESSGNTQTEYDNPVYEPVFADPCIIEYEGKYYAYATEDYGQWKPSDDPLCLNASDMESANPAESSCVAFA